MYTEKISEIEMTTAEKTRYQSRLKELIHCESQQAKWGKMARDAERNILADRAAHFAGEWASLIRKDGTRIGVQVATCRFLAPGVCGCGKAEYRFRWPYKDSNRFREAVVHDGDRIEWAPNR